MFANRGDHLFVVVNAACKAADIAHLTAHLADVAEVIPSPTARCWRCRGRGPRRRWRALVPGVAAMRFMDVGVFPTGLRRSLWVSRSGYTGEDGFEVSVPDAGAEGFARAFWPMDGVAPIGLGARDSLRLEAGLCLYGHDIDDHDHDPVEAGLNWAIQKVRRTGGAREGGFPGAARILHELATGPLARVGLRPEGRAPMREGTVLWDAPRRRRHFGGVTSGGFGPSVDAPIAMGYVPRRNHRHRLGRGARQAPARHRRPPALSPHHLQALRTPR
jgi:aminomethyltransferase